MNNRYLMTVAAAALIAGTGFANAQGTGTSREAPSSGAPTQQAAPPSERGSAATPMNRESSQSGAPAEAPKSAQSKDMDRGGAKSQRAQEDMKPGAKGEKSAQDNNMKGERSKSMSSENEKAGASKELKAEDRNSNMNRADDRSGAAKSTTTTTGQAGAGAKLSTEQRTKITTVFKSQHVQPVTNVNFSISVGTHVPRNVGFHPLPAEIVTIYPEWRGFEYFLVGSQIVVVNPRTLVIVDVIDV